MGCDIHSVAQVKDGKRWHTVLQDVAGDNRSYDTFGILANVRNGSGFAGCDTGDGYEPISEPKGFPSDFLLRPDDDTTHLIHEGTPTEGYGWVKDDADRQKYIDETEAKTEVWMGDHSHSWHTLAEIKAYMKRKAKETAVKRGIIPAEMFDKLDGTNEVPESWCGGVGGRDIVTYTAKDYREQKRMRCLPATMQIYVQYEWTVDYFRHTYMKEIVASLERLATKHKVSDEDVRMVFGFDS